MPRRSQGVRRRRAFTPVRSQAAYERLSDTEKDFHERAVEGVRLMRGGLSFTRTARELRMAPRTLRRYLGSVLRPGARGRLSAARSDRLFTYLRFPTPQGLTWLGVSSSADRSLIGKYWDAINRDLGPGRENRLRDFRGRRIMVGGVEYPFITDISLLKRLGRAGELSFPELYRSAA